MTFLMTSLMTSDAFYCSILGKVPALDFVQSLAINPRAYEPGHAVSLEELHEVSQMLAWLHNSAVQRLPSISEVREALQKMTWRTRTGMGDHVGSTMGSSGMGANARGVGGSQSWGVSAWAAAAWAKAAAGSSSATTGSSRGSSRGSSSGSSKGSKEPAPSWASTVPGGGGALHASEMLTEIPHTSEMLTEIPALLGALASRAASRMQVLTTAAPDSPQVRWPRVRRLSEGSPLYRACTAS
jgi:hypothetical protein